MAAALIRNFHRLIVVLGVVLTACTAVPQPMPSVAPTIPFVAALSSPVPPSPTPSATPLPTATLPPTGTPVPSFTPQPSGTPPPTATPAPTAVPVLVNGIPLSEFVLLDSATRENVRAIFAAGQALGRNPRTFSKLGDSVVLTDHYLTRFDNGFYNLGEQYAYLQPTIDYFAGSFKRYGVASRVGLHAWSILDPLWADKEWCLPNEDMLACEIRLNNPAFLLVRMGSNDNGRGDVFEENMRLAIEYAIGQGVVPIIVTKADRFEGDDRNNTIFRTIAADYQLPLLDFDRVATSLANGGLSGDFVHLTMGPSNDFTQPNVMDKGYPVHDLVVLMMLDQVRQETAGGA